MTMSLALDVGTIGRNALATNNGWRIWGDQISSPKEMYVIATLGTKLYSFHLTVIGKPKQNRPLLKTLYIQKQLFSTV